MYSVQSTEYLEYVQSSTKYLTGPLEICTSHSALGTS